MELATLVQDIHRLNHELERFERKYGVMSETFYESYIAGEEPEDDAWVLDFEKWAGLYEVWRDRQRAYYQAVTPTRNYSPAPAGPQSSRLQCPIAAQSCASSGGL